MLFRSVLDFEFGSYLKLYWVLHCHMFTWNIIGNKYVAIYIEMCLEYILKYTCFEIFESWMYFDECKTLCLVIVECCLKGSTYREV